MEIDERAWTDSPGLDSVHDVRLSALLRDLLKERTQSEVAETLGVNRKTLSGCLKSGRLSRRMRDALERYLLSAQTLAAEREKERVAVLERRVELLEAEMRSALEELRAAVASLSEGCARAAEDSERRLSLLEETRGNGNGAIRGETGDRELADAASRSDGLPPVVTQAARDGVVSIQSVPGEEIIHGAAMPLVEEWRRLRKGHPDDGSGLDWIVTEGRLLELEIEMLHGLGLTLPPNTEPLRGFARTEQVAWRRRALEDTRRRRERLERLRTLRRLLTLGLWRK